MRLLGYALVCLATISCSEEESIKYAVTGTMTLNSQEVSNVKIAYSQSGEPLVSNNDGLNIVEYLPEGGELWFHFTAQKGELYEVSWQDSWWEEFTAGSILVTAFEADKQTNYFQEIRIIQATGCPKMISIPNDGEVYIKVRGFDTQIEGSFALHVKRLDLESAIPIPMGTSMSFDVSAGELKLFVIEVEKDSSYTLHIEASEFTGAYGDGVEVLVTALRENYNFHYFFEVIARYPGWTTDDNYVNKHFTALSTERIFVGVIGAYWGTPRDVILAISRD